MESAWKQWGVKNGISLDDYIEYCIENQHPTFLKTAQSWKEIADQLTVLPIEVIGNVQEHFAEWCDLDFGKLEMVEKANRTFDWALLDLFSQNPQLFSSQDDNELFDFLDRALPEEAPRDGHGLMTAEQAARVRSAFEAENREIRRLFFPDLPASDWDRPADPDELSGRLESFGSTESIYRNLAIQLAITMKMHQQLEAGDPHLENHWQQILSLHARADRLGESIARRFDRLRTRLDREEARRRALEKRVEQLEARSFRKLVSRWIPGKPKR